MYEIELSIIIPIYNAVDYIDRIFAYFERYDEKFELIFIDDCSRDGSYEYLLNKVTQSSMHTVVLKNQKNSGAGITRNNGINNAHGRYITFLDSDDYFTDDYFRTIMPLLTKEHDMIVYDAFIVSDDLASASRFPMFYYPMKDGVINKREALAFIKGGTWGKVYRTKYIIDNNIKFLDLKRNEDMPFTKIATAKANRIFYLSKPLYCYYQNPKSLMHNKSLLTPTNAQRSFEFVKQQISDDYPEEVEAIFLVEFLYSTVITNAKLVSRKNLREYIYFSEKIYPSCYKNKYLKYFSSKIKVILTLIKLKQSLILTIIAKMK